LPFVETGVILTFAGGDVVAGKSLRFYELHYHWNKGLKRMNDNTPLHVLWGVFNNPFTPEKTKEEVKAMIAKLVAKDKTSKLSKKITSVLN
tara:strand:+ start:3087 stop:3359 length:273 start_codon:yes stop_codon:yes gene_type:complete